MNAPLCGRSPTEPRRATEGLQQASIRDHVRELLNGLERGAVFQAIPGKRGLGPHAALVRAGGGPEQVVMQVHVAGDRVPAEQQILVVGKVAHRVGDRVQVVRGVEAMIGTLLLAKELGFLRGVLPAELGAEFGGGEERVRAVVQLGEDHDLLLGGGQAGGVGAVELRCEHGVLIALSNHTLRPITRLGLELKSAGAVRRVESVRAGPVAFEPLAAGTIRFAVPLEASDFIIVSTK